MELSCYDLSWNSSESGGLYLEALVKDGDGKRVEKIPAPFDPYCYIKEDDLVMDPLRVTNCRIGEGAPEGFLKIEADHPNAIKDFRERFAFQTFEADVFFDRRVAINEDVTFERPDRGDILYFDIEVDDRGQFADPEDADSRVIAIAAVGGDGREFYFYQEDEDELLHDFLGAADDYVALAGWNALDYDYRYLENRLAHKGETVHWNRWVRHDLMPLYDMLAVPTKTVSLKLDDTGERELGAGKTGVKPGDGRRWELWSDDPDTLREYNMRDAEIVRDIDQKYGLVELLHVTTDLCNYPPGGACYLTKHDRVRFAIGQVVDAKLLEVAHRKGIPQPNKLTYDKPDDFPGGYVLKPRPGMYEWLMAPDYGSMYPNIIRAWNFGRETWVEDDQVIMDEEDGVWRISGGEYKAKRAIKGETGAFVHPEDGPRSVPAETADELVELRDGAAEIVDKGVKAVNNCFVGDTEVMTPDRGPVNIKEMEVGDEVYSINPETLECEVKPVVETTEEPNAYSQLVHFNNSAVDLKVTPNHRMIASRGWKDEGFDIYEANRMESGRWAFPDHSPMGGLEPDEITLEPVAGSDTVRDIDPDNDSRYNQSDMTFDVGDLLEFMGWYIAEGHATPEDQHGNRVTIAQSDDENRRRVSELLSSMDVDHSVSNHQVRFSSEKINRWCREILGGTSKTKTLPDWVFQLDATLLERLHGSLMAGDGSTAGRSAVYATVSDQLRSDFMRLMVQIGKKPRCTERDCYEIYEHGTHGVSASRDVEREDHDGDVYCVSVLDNHTVLAGRNGVMQWTGQTLYGIFAADHQRYFGPHSENITLIGQELTGTVERIADRGHKYIRDVVYGDTDSLMIDMEAPDDIATDDAIEAAKIVTQDIQNEMRSWASAKGAEPKYLTLDLDDVYDRFYIGDKKKRYFGHRIFNGEPCDNFKVRGFETRQGDWPEPVRDFQEDLMKAKLAGEPTAPIVDEAKSALFSGRWDLEMATSTTLNKPLDEYETPLPHTRAAAKIRSHHGHSAVQVGDKVDYIKYGDGRTDIAWIYDGEIGVNFRPNDAYCRECGEVVREGDHDHETEPYPHLRNEHYGYLWGKKFVSVMESIGVSEHNQASLGAFA